MKKRHVLKYLGLFLVISLLASVLLACGPEQPTTPTTPTTPGGTTTPTTTTTPTQKIIWRANAIVASNRTPNTPEFLGRLNNLIAERSGGRFEIQYHWNNELGFGHREYPKILKEGFSEISDLPWLMGAGYIPEMAWQAYALYQGPSGDTSPATELKLRDVQVPFYNEFAQEWDFTLLTAIKTIYGEGMQQQELTSAKPVRGLNDLKGLVIRVASPEGGTFWANFGAKGLVIPMPEMYMGMKSGLIDATISGRIIAFEEFQMHEVAKYLIPYSPRLVDISNWGWAASNRHLVKLPPDLQKIMTDSFKDYEGWLDQLVLDQWESPRWTAAEQKRIQQNIEVIELPRDDMLTIQALADKDLATWLVKTANDRGRAMYKAVMDTSGQPERYNTLIEMGRQLTGM